MLGVHPRTLARFGAVSKETALEMALGARTSARTDIAIAVTGVAGPGGGSAEKPVGLVHIAAAALALPPQHLECRFGEAGRGEIRMLTLRQSLDLTRQMLRQAS
jgi:nicotinamide-nucleotide amidase